jgi:hypothetical protein
MEAGRETQSVNGKRFQFPIREILVLTMLFALVLGALATGGGSLFQSAQILAETLGPLGAAMGIAVAGRRGIKTGVFIGLAGAGFLLLADRNLCLYLPFSSDTEHLGVLFWLTMLLMAFLIYWNLQRTPPTAAGEADLRIVARFSVLLTVLLILLLFLRDRSVPQWLPQGRSPSDSWAWIDSMMIVLMGLPLLPWVVLDRRRAAGPSGRPFSRWDTAAKILLGIAATLGPVTLGVTVVVLLTPPGSSDSFAVFGKVLIAGMCLVGGSLAAGAFLVAGFTIELYRNRWRLPLTIFSALWLFVLWAWAVCWWPSLHFFGSATGG